MKKKSNEKKATPHSILNRRARFDYELDEELVVGMSLTGREVRAARDGHVSLKGAFVTIRGDELWLNNASFSLSIAERGTPSLHTVDTTPRRLLAHRKEITALAAKKKQGESIVPTKMLTSKRHIKLVIALGKGKKHYDKRETIKRRDQDRDTQRALKHY